MTKSDVNKIIDWLKEFFNNHKVLGAVVGMSGGKDSLITAKLLTCAIGKDNVVGVIMPNGKMTDMEDAVKSCDLLGIRHYCVDINNTYNTILENTKSVLEKEKKDISTVTTFNTPPRIRMATLYAIAGSLGYVVANTSNLSEAMVGYTTKWGDNVGDISPIANFTKTEVCQIGLLLGLDKNLVLKAPSDGLTGKSDEDSMGITYDELDNYIRTGKKCANYERITALHNKSKHKRSGVYKYMPNLKNHFKD